MKKEKYLKIVDARKSIDDELSRVDWKQYYLSISR